MDLTQNGAGSRRRNDCSTQDLPVGIVEAAVRALHDASGAFHRAGLFFSGANASASARELERAAERSDPSEKAAAIEIAAHDLRQNAMVFHGYLKEPEKAERMRGISKELFSFGGSVAS